MGRLDELDLTKKLSKKEEKAALRGQGEEPAEELEATDEDWRNREKRPQYAEAVEEMIEREPTPTMRRGA